MVEESSNRILEFAGAAVNTAAQLPFSKEREPAFDQVKPGAAGRGEVQMEAHSLRESGLCPFTPSPRRRSLKGDRRSAVGAPLTWVVTED
jgi:hypothetical protein